MKRILLMAALTLVLASAVSAQETRNYTINAGAGLDLPMGDFGDAADLGFHGTLGLAWLVAPKMYVGPTASFHFFGAPEPLDGSWTDLQLGGTIKFLLGQEPSTTEGGSQVRPFLVGDVGLAILGAPDFEIEGVGTVSGGSDTNPFIAFGGGVDINEWFINGKFNIIMTEGSSSTFIPLTFGRRF